MLKEHGHRKSRARLERQITPMSDAPGTIIRTRIYRGRWTPSLDEALTRCRHQQRAMYNRTINGVARQGGAVPATMKSPAHPDGFYGQLTEWRREKAWIADIPVALARPAVAQAREALKAHEGAVVARCARLLDESAAWAKWMAENPWDPGAWDALSADEKRERAGKAPPRSASTWRDERGGDGSPTELYRRRKRTKRCAVSWNTPPKRVDAQTLRLPGLGDIEVRAPNGLPEASRLRAARVCVRKGRRGRCRVEVHLSVRVDVEGRVPDTETAVAGADMGCADTLTLHDGSTLTLPEHEEALEKALKAQRAMSRCVRGSRQWKNDLERLRTQRRAMSGPRPRRGAQSRARDCAGVSRHRTGVDQHQGHGGERPRPRPRRRGREAGAQPAHPRGAVGIHAACHRERHGGRRRRGAQAAGHGLEPHRRPVRTRRCREPQRESVPLRSVRTRGRRRHQRGKGHAATRAEMARVEIGWTQ